MLRFIGRRRIIYGPYNGTGEIPGSLGMAVAWAKKLETWQPEPVEPQPRRRVAPGGASSAHESVWSDPSSLSLAEAEEQLRADKGMFLYRAMMQDRSDLQVPHPASSQGLQGRRLVDAVFAAVRKGSTVTSPFLHFSWDFTQARFWHMRGKVTRGEQGGYMARVSIKDLEKLAAQQGANRPQAASSQGGAASSQEDDFVATTGKLIDLSSSRAAQKAFGRKWCREDVVQRQFGFLGICQSHKEVLVPFRGTIPEAIFELIDEDTGLSKGPLGKAASVARDFYEMPPCLRISLAQQESPLQYSTPSYSTV